MRVLVTGGAGFIGYHFSKYLIQKGITPIIIDNLCYSYYPIDLKLDRLKSLGFNYPYFINNQQYTNLNSSAIFIKADLSEPDTLTKVLPEDIDYIVHLGSHASVPYSLKDPNVYIQKDMVAFQNILNFCVQRKIKHLVFASTSSVYGKDCQVPFRETDIQLKPISIYAASKACMETLAFAYSSTYSIHSTALRFFSVYGPYGRPDMAMWKFAEALLKDREITINGDGSIKRSYTYIDDVVESIYRAMLFSDKQTQLFDYFNVGSENSTAIIDVLHVLELACNKKANITFKDALSVDMPITYASMDKFYSIYGYRSKVDYKDGSRYFVQWLREYINR